jgi:hypothetical protein
MMEAQKQTTEELAEEFTENGMSDVAEYLTERGVRETRKWLDAIIALEDDPEGWRLGNLEVARERLATFPE